MTGTQFLNKVKKTCSFFGIEVQKSKSVYFISAFDFYVEVNTHTNKLLFSRLESVDEIKTISLYELQTLLETKGNLCYL